ncbi:zinc finger CCCH domain-containing protein 3-like isoform X2 [Curcuma longa]|uniref:zinc finger CCCH domain-containing protein 3-like isoform X2 n=1 Tax=Curcuma longa TaxID=136217 RepID=UPI003D9EA6CE
MSAGSSNNASLQELGKLMENLKIGKEGQERVDASPNSFPQRPGEPDCKYYLRTGCCRYGSKCKYNHPTVTEQETMHRDELHQRDDKPDCQFFLKTGFCKFGTTCKYHHPQDKHAVQLPLLNVFGLPLRKDVQSCSYFMKTGSCKFGVTCKFNHPDPTNVGAMFFASGPSVYGFTGYSTTTGGSHSSGGYPTWPSSWTLYQNNPYAQGPPAYSPHMVPPNQATMPMQQNWSTFMPPASASVPSMNDLGPSHAQPSSSTAEIFPERPDEPDCEYYMKTGNCKYGSSCKYNHPKGRNQEADCVIGPYGLPLRPGLPKCKYYAANGNCKYGATCKFDHSVIAIYPWPEAASTSAYPYQNDRELTWRVSNSSPSLRTPTELGQLKTPPRAIRVQDANDNEHESQSSTLSPNHPAPNSESSGNQSDEGYLIA